MSDIKESGSACDSRTSVIVNWRSGALVAPPVIASVMIGARFQQGISFVSAGRVLKESPWQTGL